MHLSATLSHEIRNPLTGMLSVLRLLSATPLDETQRKLLDTADNNGRALLSLLDGILQHTRNGNTGDTVVSQCFPLNELIQPLLTLFSCQAQQKGVMLVSHTSLSVPKNIHGDAGKIRQILNNLLSNAMRFTDSGIIKLQTGIETQADGSSVLCFHVADSGTGIPAAALQRIFEPHQQAGNADQRLGGTGLGLSISRRLARALGGDIHAQSVEGRGSIFTVTLPCHGTPIEASVETQHTLRVLVVDDSEIHCIAIHLLLKSLGHTVVTALCAQDAVRVLHEQRFDAIFLDVHLPDMESVAVIEQIIATTKACNTLPYIIAVSAWLDDNDMEQLLACGANAVCTKPLGRLELQEILSALHTLTRGAAQTPTADLPPRRITRIS